MAVYTVSNTGGNINAGATYVGGIVPTSTDTIVFTSTSGQLTVNTPFTIAGIDFTNWTGTLIMSAILTVNGNITLVSAMTITGTSKLVISATSTMTSNGKTWSNSLDFNMNAGSQVVTLADNWNVTGSVSFLTNTATFNGNKISIGGSLSNNTNGGTTLFELVGTGTWTSSNFRNSLTINTSGTITITGTLSYNTGTLTRMAGTVVTTGSTLLINSSTTLNTNGINWNNVNIIAGTITNNSLLTINGTLTLASSSNVVFAGTHGFTTNSLSCVTAGRTITFKDGVTYTVNSSLTLTGTSGSRITVNSSTTSYAYLTLAYGATQNVTNTNATWINSGGGDTIKSSFGTLSDTVNWEVGQGYWWLMFNNQN
jgi:hypothetical protein